MLCLLLEPIKQIARCLQLFIEPSNAYLIIYIFFFSILHTISRNDIIVLNFANLHQMTMVLNEAGLASDAAFTVKEQFSITPGLSSLPEVSSGFYICIIIIILQ